MPPEPLFTTFDAGIPLAIAAAAALFFYAGVFLADRLDGFDPDLGDEPLDPAPRFSVEDETR